MTQHLNILCTKVYEIALPSTQVQWMAFIEIRHLIPL